MPKPIELISMYWERVWNNGETELIRQICADPITRFEGPKTTRLSHDEQIARINGVRAKLPGIRFTHVVLQGDDRQATSVWNMYSDTLNLCGIETMVAKDHRLSETYISEFWKGHWAS